MHKALVDMDLEDSVRKELEAAFWRTADHMRNRAESAGDDRLPVFSRPPSTG